jgi:hypothetical protein
MMPWLIFYCQLGVCYCAVKKKACKVKSFHVETGCVECSLKVRKNENNRRRDIVE